MDVIKAYNVNDAFAAGLGLLAEKGVEEPTRNGPVLVAPGPVTTVYSRPLERVLLSSLRDANPFFHLFEALWMLAGRNDAALPSTFVPSFVQFSDDGKTINGAYGHRWRHRFGYDQLEEIIAELRANPSTRRAYLAMWDAMGEEHWNTGGDLLYARADGKDAPCNVGVCFDLRGGQLNMTVFCRSNDIVLGCYGANAVHFSFLLEYLAARLQVPTGEYRQVSNNFHYYLNFYKGSAGRASLSELGFDALKSNPYKNGSAIGYESPEGHVPLLTIEYDRWFKELNALLAVIDADGWSGNEPKFEESFFETVAAPMLLAWYCYKAGLWNGVYESIAQIADPYWSVAASSWLERRFNAREAKNARS